MSLHNFKNSTLCRTPLRHHLSSSSLRLCLQYFQCVAFFAFPSQVLFTFWPVRVHLERPCLDRKLHMIEHIRWLPWTTGMLLGRINMSQAKSKPPFHLSGDGARHLQTAHSVGSPVDTTINGLSNDSVNGLSPRVSFNQSKQFLMAHLFGCHFLGLPSCRQIPWIFSRQPV